MFFKEFWFSTKGRATRSDFWFGWLFPASFLLVMGAIADGALGISVVDEATIGPFAILAFIFYVCSGAVLFIKRFHDFNLSGWLALVVLVPALNAIALAAVLLIKGNNRENKFGENPYADASASNLSTFLGLNIGFFALMFFAVNSGWVDRPSGFVERGDDSTALWKSLADRFPPDQLRFNIIVMEATGEYSNATNEAVQNRIRKERDDELCDLLFKKEVKNWVGTVTEIESNRLLTDGIDITVQVSPYATIETDVYLLSGMQYDNTIQIDDPIYKSIETMSLGDRVVVSGQFFPDPPTECLASTGIGSLHPTKPAFWFEFSSIELLNEK